tara:strand:+ start:269 stop:454 length:186 start_codon:yes stop_codon:yes gene_type:complete
LKGYLSELIIKKEQKMKSFLKAVKDTVNGFLIALTGPSKPVKIVKKKKKVVKKTTKKKSKK